MAKTAHPVVLTVPRGASSISAMRLVVGWVGSCNDVPLEQIDDINLALETLVAGESEQGGPFSLTLSTEEDEVRVVLNGLDSRHLRANLEAGDEFTPSVNWPLDVRIFLSALTDEYILVDCGEVKYGVLMKKRIC